MEDRENNNEFKAKSAAVIASVIVIAIVTGLMAWGANASFGTWVGMFLSLLVAVIVLIYIMGYK
jgi:hypothetical protein